MNSINAKDTLYKLSLQTPTDSPDYQQLKTNVRTYKNIIRTATIMHAKRDYYRKTFNLFSDNIRKTWQTINDALNRKRSSKDFPQEFILVNGKIISDHKQIANAFNDFSLPLESQNAKIKMLQILLVNIYLRKQILIYYSRQLQRKRLVTLLTI